MSSEAKRSQRRQSWDRDGYFIVKDFASPAMGARMLERVVEISRAAGGAGLHDGALVMPESNIGPREPAERGVSKVFRLHRQGVFREFLQEPDLGTLLQELLGPDVDCFLSQFIFKNPSAWGQPWHQDSHYFPFDRSPQVGLWLAVSAATLENGCLHVLPGSHREPIHQHLPDRRPGANYGYLEITDHDMSGELAVLMNPGDLLVFHSHLMHRSSDNLSDGLRAAMVYHCAEQGTLDRGPTPSPVNDWMPLLRDGRPVPGS